MTGPKMALALAAAFFTVTLVATAAPVPAAKPTGDKWEYYEIQSSYTISRVMPGGGPAGGGAGGGAGGNALPAGGRLAVVRKTVIRFIADGEEIETEGWEALATKLKAPAGKAKASVGAHKLRVFNQLGQSGWELMAQGRDASSAADVWTFKRKVAK